jgi:hypothetical protein
MKKSLITLLMMLSSVTAYSVEVVDEDIISDDEAALEKTLEKEEVAEQKFTQLVKSTLELMGPSTEETTPIATDTTSLTP